MRDGPEATSGPVLHLWSCMPGSQVLVCVWSSGSKSKVASGCCHQQVSPSLVGRRGQWGRKVWAVPETSGRQT